MASTVAVLLDRNSLALGSNWTFSWIFSLSASQWSSKGYRCCIGVVLVVLSPRSLFSGEQLSLDHQDRGKAAERWLEATFLGFGHLSER